jgi:hypothetical protein
VLSHVDAEAIALHPSQSPFSSASISRMAVISRRFVANAHGPATIAC